MSTIRKRYSAEFKAKLALEVVKGNRTLAEIASEAQVHPNLLMQWKKQLLDSLPSVFADKRVKDNKEQEEKEAQLYQQIGQLKVELDWLKKNQDGSVERLRQRVEAGMRLSASGGNVSFLGLSRSGYYYQPSGESDFNRLLMRLIDQEYTAHPFFGYRKMVYRLRKAGHAVTKKRIARLMQVMGLQAMVPGPHTSRSCPQNPVYPYRLRGVKIEAVDQVWSCDITYIPLPKGFVYLFAIIDWYSRFVLSWQLSNTLDTTFCCEGLEQALSSGKPGIFNSDQGVQFTSKEFTGLLLAADIIISMDGRGRALDNIFVERLWRTVKYEDVYLKGYETPKEVHSGLRDFFHFYNEERPHQALDNKTPANVYRQSFGC